MFLAFAFSLQTIRNKSVVAYMQGFYWYSVIAIILSGIGIVQFISNNSITGLLFLINKVSYIFHYVFLGAFISRVVKSHRVKRVLLFFLVIFLIVITYILIRTLNQHQSYVIQSITNFALVFCCLFYYFDLFENIPVKNLFKEPAFWVITGLFLCLTISVPLNTVRNFYLRNSSDGINLYAGAISGFAYGIMHLFFVKAYLCSINLKAAY